MLHRRRFLTTTSSGLALGAVALLLGRGALAQPSYTVPLAQLQEMVAPKFPRSVPVQGLFDLTLQVPLLRLLPEVNRLGATMAVDAAGPALRRSHAGLFDVEFALSLSFVVVRAPWLKPAPRPASIVRPIGGIRQAVVSKSGPDLRTSTVLPAELCRVDQGAS
jgi:hypothetical protein